MDAIPFTHPSHARRLLGSSSLTSHPTAPRNSTHLYLLTSQTRRRQQRSLQNQALNDVLSVAASSKHHGGDISVLLPISSVMLFMYFLANFVVPSMIMNDFRTSKTKAQGEDEEEVQEEEDEEE